MNNKIISNTLYAIKWLLALLFLIAVATLISVTYFTVAIALTPIIILVLWLGLFVKIYEGLMERERNE